MFPPCYAMGPMAPKRYPGGSLTLILGRERYSVHEGIIKQYLPKLWRKSTHCMLDVGYLDLEGHGLPHGPNYHKAATLLLQYLCEVDRKSPVSAALSTGLEEIWRRSTSRGGDGPFATYEVFEALTTIFEKQNFGCNAKIFREMESFFQRHCAEILERGLQYTTHYISGLSRMSVNNQNIMDMASVLAPVVRQMHSRGLDARMLKGFLGLRAQRTLATLDRQEQQRPSSPPRFGTHLTPALAHRPLLHRGISLPQVSLRGDQVDPATRLHLAKHHPHRLSIDDGGLGIRGPYAEDDFFDDDSVSSIDGLPFKRHSHHDHLLDEFHPGQLFGSEPRLRVGSLMH